MESQELSKNKNSYNFKVEQSQSDFVKKEGSLRYFTDRIASITGYAKSDVKIVVKCFYELLEECLNDVHENPDIKYFLGPIEIYGKRYTKEGTWTNPKTGEIVKLYPHIIPCARLRPKYKDTFSAIQLRKRKEAGLDINGESLD